MFPKRLTDGYQGFLDGRFSEEHIRYAALAEEGQKPEILLIGCVDSRVSPEVIFNSSPGEILVVRNVANLAPAYELDRTYQHGTSAAVEFSVQALEVKHIVVLGHALCGGIRAYADQQKPLSSGDFIGRWMSQIAPVADKLGPPLKEGDADYLRRFELASIELSLENLMTFPWVRSKVESGELTLHGAYFSVATGELLVRDPQTRQFSPLVDGVPERFSSFRCA